MNAMEVLLIMQLQFITATKMLIASTQKVAQNYGLTVNDIRIKGSFECYCWEGFEGTGVFGDCHNINECSYYEMADGGEGLGSTKNTNFAAIFQITLFKGDLEVLRRDINGTDVMALGCDANAHCVDLTGKAHLTAVHRRNSSENNSFPPCDSEKGTFTCKCNKGYEGNGTHCDDINECLTDGHLCDTGPHGNGNCTNTPGGFECWCPPPYVGSGRAGDWLVSKVLAPLAFKLYLKPSSVTFRIFVIQKIHA